MSARPLALVTGGRRRLGAAIAARLATAGYNLALHGREAGGELDAALAAAIRAGGARAEDLTADLADGAAAEALPGEASARFGRPVALLVNSASAFAWDTPADATMRGLLDHYAANAAAPTLLARAVARQGAPGACVVNILDQRVAQPIADQFSYTMSKVALAEMTPVLARFFAPGLRVNAVAPGLTIPTPDYSPGQLGRLAARMPLRALPRPEEVAEAVLFLARAGAVTGQVIFVDGGAHLERWEADFVRLERDARD